MGQLACCKDKDKDEEVNEQVDIYNQNQNYGITYPCIKREQIFNTKPPCWFGHRCECPCHIGGKCIFKLKSK